LEIALVGPFEVLSGRFDRRTPRLSPFLHWRYHLDPPEFFTVLAGEDTRHWGCFLDDPAKGDGCVMDYYANEAFCLAPDGDTIFEAVRLELEYSCHYADYPPADSVNYAQYEEELRQTDDLRQALMRYAGADRPEVGEAYTDKYSGRTARAAHVVAETSDGAGVTAPPGTFRPLSLSGKKLRLLLYRQDDPAAIVDEARQALRDGFPATALQLGRELWPLPGARKRDYAYELLDAAYAALGRETLRTVLRTHREHRDLPSVDIFDAEKEMGNGEA
ncbi:MAG TPA: ADP-ribosylation family protein, partial [Gemmataceae bacterium]|nr:ADP-ribosylation family protein [Gemmataceae bacterium]